MLARGIEAPHDPETRPRNQVSHEPLMKRLAKTLYRRWMRLAHTLGRVQTYLLLTLIYFVGMALVATFVRLLTRDPLDRRLGDRASVWVPKPKTNLDLEQARHLF